MKNEEFSDDKLKEMLKNSSSGPAFNVPDGYFDSLSEKVMDSINALPDFEKQPVTQPFSVPADYFEKLPENINNRITSTKENKFSIWDWFFKPSRLIPVTFSFLLFIGGYFYFTRTQSFKINNDTYTEEDLDDSQYLQSLDDTDMIEYLANQSDDITTDEYEQYLLDHDIEISQLEKNL
jgi:hypothetical protein